MGKVQKQIKRDLFTKMNIILKQNEYTYNQPKIHMKEVQNANK